MDLDPVRALCDTNSGEGLIDITSSEQRTIAQLFALNGYCNHLLSYLRDEQHLRNSDDLANASDRLRVNIINSLTAIILELQLVERMRKQERFL